MLTSEEARRAVKDAERNYLEAARVRFGPVGESREARARYDDALASLVAASDQARLVGIA